MNSIFLDTDFFLDIFDKKRERHLKATEVLKLFLSNSVELYTSSDIISTISYFLQKKLDLKNSVTHIDFIVQEVIILVADNEDFITLNQIILQELEDNIDLNIDYEDCMQLFLANKHQVQNILTSDKRFCEGIAENYFLNIISLEDCLTD